MNPSKPDSNNTNRLGTLIRFHRNLNKMTQKELADKCGLNESTIRNYELGNRYPEEETLHAIADALEVNYYALAEPTASNPSSALHMLFDLEWQYNLVPKLIDGNIYLGFEKKSYEANSTKSRQIENLEAFLRDWYDVRNKLNENEMSRLDYVSWESKYPTKLDSIDEEEQEYVHMIKSFYQNKENGNSNPISFKFTRLKKDDLE